MCAASAGTPRAVWLTRQTLGRIWAEAVVKCTVAELTSPTSVIAISRLNLCRFCAGVFMPRRWRPAPNISAG